MAAPGVTVAEYTMTDVVADLREIPAQVRRELTPALKRVAEPIVRDAKANADWSSRIPGAIRISVTKNGVLIVVNLKKAPHARAYEGMSSDRVGNFRHPVYGNEEVWVSQRERPFLMPAVQKHIGEVQPAIEKVVEDALRARGFR